MSGEITDPRAYKARVREALDVLQNYVGDDGKINATKLTQEIKRLRAENATLLAERDALAQDAARWLYVRRYMKLDDIGDEAFCLGLVIDSDALEHAVSDEASRLHEERRAAEWEGVQGPNNGPKDLPPVTLEEAIDAAVAGREEEG